MSIQVGAIRKFCGFCFAVAMIALCSPGTRVWADSDDEPTRYSRTQAHDPVAVLIQRLDSGAASLTYETRHGYLESLLKNLNVPESSQGLVFSKTSFQRDLISPHKPRALYFNDDVYVGFVQNAAVLELASMDKNLGAVFYVLKQKNVAKPRPVRLTYECLQCHESGMTRNVPGLMMRSVYTDMEGQPLLAAGTFQTNDRSPLNERWGGWYVTGHTGSQLHMGNVTCDDEDHVDQTHFAAGANLASLAKLVKTEPYLRDTSDAVALMVFAHQQNLHNLLTAANYEVRAAERDAAAMNRALGRPSENRSESTQRRICSACEPVVKAMLFSGEAAIVDPIEGSSGFAEDFSARGPRDKKGRSLRDFDLTHRLFKHPLSFLIYSEQFDGLPGEAKDYIYQRLWDILDAKDQSKAFEHLSDEDRVVIRHILRETKKDLPTYWTRSAQNLK